MSAIADGGLRPLDPQRGKKPPLGPLGLGGDPTPYPRPVADDSPATAATDGDAPVPLLGVDQILELGIVTTRTGGRTIVLEVAGDPEQALRRLIGGALVKSPTCRDLRGELVALPAHPLQRHDFEVHRDLWLKGRGLAELEELGKREVAHADRPRGAPELGRLLEFHGGNEVLARLREIERRDEQMMAPGGSEADSDRANPPMALRDNAQPADPESPAGRPGRPRST